MQGRIYVGDLTNHSAITIWKVLHYFLGMSLTIGQNLRFLKNHGFWFRLMGLPQLSTSGDEGVWRSRWPNSPCGLVLEGELEQNENGAHLEAPVIF